MVERFHFAGQRAEILQDRVADGLLQDNVLDAVVTKQGQGRLHILKPANRMSMPPANHSAQITMQDYLNVSV